jgi:type III restriction enzyme
MLYETFNANKESFGEDFFTSRLDDDVVRNLNPKFELREYQKEALGRFDFYFGEYQKRAHPAQLLFHMATGSGKTLIMAANILQLYKQGYRNFIFFVNSTTIIEKTRDNFLNSASLKYLFSEKIVIGNKVVDIKEMNNFEAVSKDAINIHFTTIQMLHSRLNEPKENSITFEDLKNKEFVFLSDEAHHINTLTKLKNNIRLTPSLFDNGNGKIDLTSLTEDERKEVRSWEGTVMRMFNSNDENILLEFTATIDIANESVRNKYEDKIIFRYDLKSFRNDGYSKEIEVLEVDLRPIERALQAVVLSQYRKKVAQDHGKNFKPVVLFKANYVNPPKKRNEDSVVSEEFEEKFYKAIKNLNSDDLKRISQTESEAVQKAFNYFKKSDISLSNLAEEIRVDFDKTKCVSVNSKNDNEEKQILINSLEDSNNGIRAVFAVDQLNEGWDVLNLFDIVRLYNTRDARKNKPGKTTMREAQLIGRGARYYPFKIKGEDSAYKRKFDDDIKNELRILEQLYYHSSHNPKYIQELKQAMRDIGIYPERTIEKTLEIKKDFQQTEIWQTGLIFTNKKIFNRIKDVESFLKLVGEEKFPSYHLYSGVTSEGKLFGGKFELETQEGRIKSKKMALSEFGKNVLRSAMDRIEFYKFDNLKEYLTNIGSILEFIENDKHLKNVRVEVFGTEDQLKNIKPEEALQIVLRVLSRAVSLVKSKTPEYIGTEEFEARKVSEVFKDKVIKIDADSEKAKGMQQTLDLVSKSWYAQNENYGTSEEKGFVQFLDRVMSKLQKQYHNIALLRNERQFHIYNFDDGRVFEPDFVLFLKNKKTNRENIYQVFIEPKGDQFKDNKGLFNSSKEGWKQKLLVNLEKRARPGLKLKDKEFQLIGLPFYNEKQENAFEKEFNKVLMQV